MTALPRFELATILFKLLFVDFEHARVAPASAAFFRRGFFGRLRRQFDCHTIVLNPAS